MELRETSVLVCPVEQNILEYRSVILLCDILLRVLSIAGM